MKLVLRRNEIYNKGLFNLFKKKSPREVFRKKVRDAFEESVKYVRSQLTGESFIDGMLVQASIGNMRKALLDAPELQILGLTQDWIPEEIIDEECSRVLSKYLK